MRTVKMKRWIWCCAVTEISGVFPSPHECDLTATIPSHSSLTPSAATASGDSAARAR